MLPIIETASPALEPALLPTTEVHALYVHIPFCFHKCHYCDFYSITRQTPERMERFVELILREAERWDASPVSIRPHTVFFGGGTPTLLPLEQMRSLLAGLRSRIDFSGAVEWTVEANPATVTPEYCVMLREMGVNRLSFGAQSFDPAELRILERHHDPLDVPRSIEMARSGGFERLNLDLIFAIPGQSFESWQRSLEAALAIATPHLSCYGLTYEPNTPITVRRRLGQLDSVEESLELEMLRYTRSRLTAIGLPPYEISNFARPGGECLHNLTYWTGGNYIALGPSGASHVEGWRWRNRPHLGEWERAMEGTGSQALLPAIEVEHLSPHRRAGELAMLLLRLSRGLDFADFEARTRFDPRVIFADPIERFSRVGLLSVDRAGVRVTEKGLIMADALSAAFLELSA